MPGRGLARAGLVLGVVLALGLPAGAAAAEDWTRWKFGAANTGVNPSETRLGPGNVRGLRRTWFLDQCCVGTPLVAGGLVFTGALENGLEGPGLVLALDAATGASRWSTPTGTPEPPSGLALAGGRLFASLGFESAGRPMVALDAATGRQLWSLDLAPGDPAYFYGPPNVAGGVVYATGGDNKIWALEAATGRVRWRSYVTRTAAATGPVAIAGGLVHVAGGPDNDGVLLAKDVDNGVNRWKAFPARDGGRGRLLGSPSVRGGRVFVATEEGSVLAYRAAGCLPALTCKPLWVRQLGASSPFDPTPGLGQTTVFVGGLGRLHALDAATGRSRWSGLVEFTGDESAVTAPVIANGVVYATTVDNRVYAFSSAGCHSVTCQPLWSAEINPDEYSTATRPLSVTGGAVYASAHPTGLTRWAVPTAGQARPAAG
jgi:outer membrane protein assembly factor BamB